MKKMGIVLLAALTALSIGTAAAEGVKIDGSIKAGETKTILAPYSGVSRRLYRAGRGRGVGGRRTFYAEGAEGLCRV